MREIGVVWPIMVPEGKYCWNPNVPGVCKYFDNEDGFVSCSLNFYGQKDSSKGVLKDPKCLALVKAPLVTKTTKPNNTSYAELKSMASHIADCADLDTIITDFEEKILDRLQNLTDEELEKEKEFIGYES